MINQNRIDITYGYNEWFSIGCALKSEFGEAGREYFHQVSQFNDKYSFRETDKKYDSIMRSNGTGITIGTFFGYAKDYGITFT